MVTLSSAALDPLEDRVIIWTRAAPSASIFVRAPVQIRWEVASDTQFKHIVTCGTVFTSDEIDYTVKVDVKGLKPSTVYFYRFTALDGSNQMSVTGRTKTLPCKQCNVENLKVGVISCANIAHGYFHGYRRISEKSDIDLILGLGDMIYEYDLKSFTPYGGFTVLDRTPKPNVNLATLSDYRTRHAQYRSDVDEFEATRMFPWIIIWDDHEVADDAHKGGADNHIFNRDGPWEDRKLAATRAFHEYMPIRPLNIADDPYRIYRKFQVGNLVDFVMLDTRMDDRNEQRKGVRQNRTLYGQQQESWLFNNLKTSKTVWRLIGNQVMFAPFIQNILGWEIPLFSDIWVGYPKSRNNLLDFMMENKINNTIMFTGDFHGSVASDIYKDRGSYTKSTGQGAVFPELVIPSITSNTPARNSKFLHKLMKPGLHIMNKGAKYVDLYRHGYMVATFTREKMAAEYYYMENVKKPSGSKEMKGGIVEVALNANRITSAKEL
jgi:alkaline phosphatase D